MKRIRLRGWVLVVLRSLLIILMLFMAFETKETITYLYKGLICLVLMLPIIHLLLKYGE